MRAFLKYNHKTETWELRDSGAPHSNNNNPNFVIMVLCSCPISHKVIARRDVITIVIICHIGGGICGRSHILPLDMRAERTSLRILEDY